jgi:hypothetical protein
MKHVKIAVICLLDWLGYQWLVGFLTMQNLISFWTIQTIKKDNNLWLVCFLVIHYLPTVLVTTVCIMSSQSSKHITKTYARKLHGQNTRFEIFGELHKSDHNSDKGLNIILQDFQCQIYLSSVGQTNIVFWLDDLGVSNIWVFKHHSQFYVQCLSSSLVPQFWNQDATIVFIKPSSVNNDLS